MKKRVCCNCRHNKRTGIAPRIECHCDLDGSWLSYVTVMTHWCPHWAKDDFETENGEKK